MSDPRPLQPDEIVHLTGWVGEVFSSDPIVSWTFDEDGSADRATRFFIDLEERAARLGWMTTAGEGAGAAMWCPPGFTDGWDAILRDMDPLVRELAGDLTQRYDAFWEWIDGHHPAEPHWYLDHIAVRADRRGEGLGRVLLDHGLAAAKTDGVPAFLVTARPENVGLYERFGFAVSDSEDAPDGGPHLWFMRTAA